ncbi:MAG: dihydrodipicolinate synthase family protein [Planctomycetaceae bacterium]|nr:dihydrodipicolinate synthase family protein [Planctomycetaceae bacterium]
MADKLQGLIAATYTPLHADGTVNVSLIPQVVERLLSQNIRGLYVCGSTGEGMSLSSEERRGVTQAYVEATAGRVPVIVQVGHNSIAEACALATHACKVGADIISATCPSYFKVTTETGLIDCMQQIAAAAPQRPFYYYHIPMLTGSQLDMVTFLRRGAERMPNLAGLKYTSSTLHEFQECLQLDDGRFDVVWGLDEMLLGALATGTCAAIGSTYNIAAPLYAKLWQAFDRGDLTTARRLQADSIRFIRTLNGYPFHSAMKAVLQMQGLPMGDCRLPQGKLSQDDVNTLQQQLSDIGFFDEV